ncbi:MAG: insulinase family protein [Phycisphaerales bacterium]|nr:insulinase family protein [Phycisphaerales bacterium]
MNRIQTCTITAALVMAAASSTLLAKAGIPPRPEQIKFAELAFEPPMSEDYRHEITVDGATVPVYMAPSHEFPLVSISFSFKGGAYLEPADKVGLASMTGQMMRRGGTESVSPTDMDELFDFYAANAGTFVGSTQAGASLNSLTSNLDQTFALFMDMVRNPGFDQKKIDLYKSEAIEGMKQRNDDANAIASREWDAIMWGRDHFEARVTTETTLNNITRDDLIAFHDKLFNPNNLIISVTGDFEPSEMSARLEKALSGWASGQRMPDPPAPTHELEPGVYHVEKDVPQGKVTFGHRGLKRDDPDAIPVAIMNDILGGGGFTSRIMNRVRSDEGLAYGAGSFFASKVWYPGEFGVTYASKSATVPYALRVAMEEINKMRTEPVTEEELMTAKNQAIETFPRTFESKDGMLSVFVGDEWTNRDPSYWTTYRDKVRAVSQDDVLRVARQYLDPANVAILIVGKWEDIYKGNTEIAADPSKVTTMADFFDGHAEELPLRDPLTQKPLPKN